MALRPRFGSPTSLQARGIAGTRRRTEAQLPAPPSGTAKPQADRFDDRTGPAETVDRHLDQADRAAPPSRPRNRTNRESSPLLNPAPGGNGTPWGGGNRRQKIERSAGRS